MRYFPAIITASIVCAFTFAAWILIESDADTLIIPPAAVLPDGSRYHGDVVDGRFHGRGRLLWPNGGRYEGDFFQGLASGKGELKFASGDVYKGDFREGMMAGEGRLEMGAGRVYIGAFENGMPNGQGILQDEDGSTYEGQFVNWKFHGRGTYTGPAGEIYNGNFVDGEFTGAGVYKDTNGNAYEGEFLKWQFHGAGVYKSAEGGTYSGNFEQGVLGGKGLYQGEAGERYEGEFEDWLYHGEGVLITENGDRYTGSFAHGYFHGKGELVYAAPDADENSDKKSDKDQATEPRKQTGQWEYGQFQDPEAPKRTARLQQAVEQALYRQGELLQTAWQALLPGFGDNVQDVIDLYFVGVAGDGKQDVFLKEVSYVRDVFDRDFGALGRSIVLVNNPDTMNDTALATRISLERTLRVVAEKMDVEQDILFLYLTSHGSEDHEFSISQRGISLPDLPAVELAAILDTLPIKWRVIVISACYSGGFIPYLANDHTLVMTAAGSTRTSFGCSDTAEMTYFGKAFFKEALPTAGSFEEAFATAKKRVYEWETAEFESDDAEYSDPQISVGVEISGHLKAWWPRESGSSPSKGEERSIPIQPSD